MGNQQKPTAQSLAGQWQKVGTTGYCDLMRYSATGLEAEQYVVPVEGVPLAEYVRRYELRRTDIPYVVRVYHFEREQHRHLCQGNDFFKVITERIPKRLSDVNLNSNDAVRVYHQALQGYKIIFDNYRQVSLTEEMIGFNTNGQVRVWLNQNFGKNVPDAFNIQSRVSAGDPRGVTRPDTLMIDQLYDIVRERISQKRFSNGFGELYQQNHPTSFDDALMITQTSLGSQGTTPQVVAQPAFNAQSAISPQARQVQSRVLIQESPAMAPVPVTQSYVTQAPVLVAQVRPSRIEERVGVFNNSSSLRNVSLPSRLIVQPQPQISSQIPVMLTASSHRHSISQNQPIATQQINQTQSLVRQPVFPLAVSVNQSQSAMRISQSQSGVRLHSSLSRAKLNQQQAVASSVQYNISDRFANQQQPRHNLVNSVQINSSASGFSNILQSARSNPNSTLQFTKRHIKPQLKSERQGKAPNFIQKSDINKRPVFTVKKAEDKNEILDQGKTLVDILKLDDKAVGQKVAQAPLQRQQVSSQPQKMAQLPQPGINRVVEKQVVTQPQIPLQTGKIVIQVPLNQQRQVIQHKFVQPQVIQQVKEQQVTEKTQPQPPVEQAQSQVAEQETQPVQQQAVQKAEQQIEHRDSDQPVAPPTPPPTPVLITHKPPKFTQRDVNTDQNSQATPGFRVQSSPVVRADAPIYRARVVDQATSPIRQPVVVQPQQIVTQQIHQSQPQHVVIVDEMTFTQNQRGVIEAHEEIITTEIDAEGNAQSSGYIVDYEPPADTDMTNGVTYTATQVTDYTLKEDASGNRYVYSTTTYQYSDNPVKQYEMFIDSNTGIDRLEAYRSSPQRIHQLPPDYQQFISNTDTNTYTTVTDVAPSLPRYVNYGNQPQNRVIYQNYPSNNQPYTNVQMSYKQPSVPVSQVIKNPQPPTSIPSYQQMSQMLRGNAQVAHIEPVQSPPEQQELRAFKVD